MTLQGFEVTRSGQAEGAREVIYSSAAPEYAFTDEAAPLTELYYNVVPTLLNQAGEPSKGDPSPTAMVTASTSVGALDANIEVSVNGNILSVNGGKVMVTDPSGIVMQPALNGADRQVYRLDSGIYMLSAGGRTSKIYIR